MNPYQEYKKFVKITETLQSFKSSEVQITFADANFTIDEENSYYSIIIQVAGLKGQCYIDIDINNYELTSFFNDLIKTIGLCYQKDLSLQRNEVTEEIIEVYKEDCKKVRLAEQSGKATPRSVEVKIGEFNYSVKKGTIALKDFLWLTFDENLSSFVELEILRLEKEKEQRQLIVKSIKDELWTFICDRLEIFNLQPIKKQSIQHNKDLDRYEELKGLIPELTKEYTALQQKLTIE